MTNRTDAHRPSAIVATDYEFVEFCSAREFEAYDLAPRGEAGGYFKHQTLTGGNWYAGGEQFCRCDICGTTRALDFAIFWHKPSNVYIRTGGDCATRLCDLLDVKGFQQFRDAARAKSVRLAGEAVAEAALAAKGIDLDFAALRQASRELHGVKAGGTPREQWNVSTALDIAGKFAKYGTMSEKQEKFLTNLLDAVARREEVRALWAARHAERVATSTHIATVGDRVELVVTVKFANSYDSQFGQFWIVGLEDASANTVIYKGNAPFSTTKGQTVKLKATVKEHGERDGVKQTVIARPKVLEVVEAAAA